MGENSLDDFSSFRPLFKEFQIHLPSLSERGAEFDDIVQSLLIEMAHELKRDHVREISPAALESLRTHQWRASLRELRNILRYGILRTKTARIEDAHLPNLKDPTGILLESRDGFRRIEEDLTRKSNTETA
jgi:DNA-binding NtrC family response regulator